MDRSGTRGMRLGYVWPCCRSFPSYRDPVFWAIFRFVAQGVSSPSGGGMRASDNNASIPTQESDGQNLPNTDEGVMGSGRILQSPQSAHLPRCAAACGRQRGAYCGHRVPWIRQLGTLRATRRIQKGDYIYLEVPERAIGYRVDHIAVIEPTDTRLLRIKAEEDRRALMAWGERRTGCSSRACAGGCPRPISNPDAAGAGV